MKRRPIFFAVKKLVTAVLMITCFSFVLAFPSPVEAQEAFLITQYDVSVRSNTDNSFDFTETITMDFTEERHGILRSIPTEGGSSRYIISNVNVQGDPFTIESDALNLILRIGDANTYISGVKTYTITYTLTFDKDSDPTKDYVSLDLIGTVWDTSIQNATIDFYFPGNASVPDTYQVYTGEYGNTDQTGSTVTVESDHLRIQSNGALSNFEGVTLNATYPENTFSDAVDLPDPFQFEDYQADITIKKDRVVYYKETFDLQINDQSMPVYYRLPLSTQDNEAFTVRNVKLNGQKLDIYDTQGVFPIFLSQEGSNTIEYTVYYPKDNDPAKDPLSLMLFSNYREVGLDSATVTIHSAFSDPVSYKTTVAILKADGTGETVQNTQGGTIVIPISEPLQTGEGIFIDLVYPDGSFGFVLALFTVIALLAGVLLVLLGVYWYGKYGKDEVVSPVVEFYPPDGLSSAAVGYISSREVDPIGITSMLIYWASHNHLSFTATGKTDFIISFQSDLDAAHPQWEQNAFSKLTDLILEADNSLTKDDLQTNFYKVAEKIKPAVPLYFKNERSLDDKTATGKSRLMSFLSALTIGIFTGITTFKGLEESMPSLIAAGSAFMLSMIYFAAVKTLENGWYKRTKFKNFLLGFVDLLFGLLLIGSAVLLSVMVSTTVQLPAIVFLITAGLISQVIAVFTSKRSLYGQRILERVIGFREFLVTAEKDRLEALLNENPEYYYQTLPYALVLDVSNIWEDKFRGLQMVEPSWYHGAYPGYVFSYMALGSFASAASSSLAHYTAPPSASGTGGFSGFGGGGGGGFSGGGGGGGGGSSW